MAKNEITITLISDIKKTLSLIARRMELHDYEDREYNAMLAKLVELEAITR